MASGRAGVARRADRTEAYVVAAVALVVAVLAIWRCTLSVGLTDDAVWVAIPMRLGEGGRLFYNEMALQSFGYWVVVPFVKAWKSLFGMTGLVLAVRVFYVVVGGAVAFIVYRVLRPTFAPAACGLAAVAPVLAVPYNALGITYNTSAGLSFMLATALMFAASRDRSRPLAVGAGLAVAYGVMSYPPLLPAAAVLVATFAIVARGRKVAALTAVVALAALAVSAGLLLTFSSLTDVLRTWAYVSKNVVSVSTPLQKLGAVGFEMWRTTIADPWLAPLWVLALVACVPQLPARIRSLALLLLPAAAALSGVMRFASHQDTHFFSSVAAGYFMIFLFAALASVTVMSAVRKRSETLTLLGLAGPFAATAYLLVTYSTSAAWWRGSPVLALAPLALGVVIGWSDEVREGLGVTGVAIASAWLLFALLAALFGTSHNDQPPFRLNAHLTTGPYAGITTTPQRAAQLRDFARAAAYWVKPGDSVLVVGGPIVYLFATGPMATNAVWLNPGKSDRATVAYYGRTGDTPDVAFINLNVLTPVSKKDDPLVAYIARNYRAVDTVGNVFVVWVRKP